MTEKGEEKLPNEKSDVRVPAHIHRSALYFHALTEIWEYYRALGNNPPEEFMHEMARAERMMIEDIRSEQSQGGKFEDFYKEFKKERHK